jgi:adenine-specific DNA-methyltransferase
LVVKKKKKPLSDTKDPDNKIEQYTHNDKKRAYNPPVGLVTPQTDKDLPRKKYSYDPHLDPQLIWSGKKENTSFEVDTVSLHVHERIDPITIIENVMKKQKYQQQTLFHYFELPENNLPNRQAIEFYKHDQNWSNRLIAGDSLLVMNSLLEKEGMAGKVQMIYFDPPYGIRYGSNFQPFVNRKEVKDGKDEDLTQEPETIKAFRDTWELGIHSYLTYMRDRLILANELLSENGSCVVQISDENLHYVRNLMDEIFGKHNFISIIAFRKTTLATSKFVPNLFDYIIWYAKDAKKMKYHQLFTQKDLPVNDSNFRFLELPDGTRRKMTSMERNNPLLIPEKSRIFRYDNIISTGKSSTDQSFKFKGEIFRPGTNHHWKTSLGGMEQLVKNNRIEKAGNVLAYVRYFDDFGFEWITNGWFDTTTGGGDKIYVVQTTVKTIQRLMLMATDPGDVIFDPTCGSGTTAFVAEQLGRRWITCDTSRVAITLAKQRLMTAVFDYYDLAHPKEGIKSGFKYKTSPHVTLGSIANNDPPQQEILYDQPFVDKTKIRVTGPFTVEAVPSPTVKSFDNPDEARHLDTSVSRSGETLRQDQWRDELLKTGIRGKSGQKIEFSRVELLSGTQWIHADAETKEEPKRVVISFGPDYSPLEQRQVANAIEEAQNLVPKPKLVVFAAFQFDPEAAKDIDEINWPGVTLLKAQMNADLLTEDLKKKRVNNESFWLMGQPDAELKKQKDGKYVIDLRGFDYYNPRTGEIESGDSSKVAVWELDADYDGRSLYPSQVFFPMAGESDGWSKLTKTLKSEIDEEKIEQYRGTISLPFSLGINKRIAVKIIDDRGIESLRIIRVK